MSGLSALFHPAKASPSPLPPPPKIGDAAGEAAARSARARQHAVFGIDDTFLTPKTGLGKPAAAAQTAAPTRTMLG